MILSTLRRVGKMGNIITRETTSPAHEDNGDELITFTGTSTTSNSEPAAGGPPTELTSPPETSTARDSEPAALADTDVELQMSSEGRLKMGCCQVGCCRKMRDSQKKLLVWLDQLEKKYPAVRRTFGSLRVFSYLWTIGKHLL